MQKRTESRALVGVVIAVILVSLFLYPPLALLFIHFTVISFVVRSLPLDLSQPLPAPSDPLAQGRSRAPPA